MDATQMINDSLLESDEEENDANQTSRGIPVAKLHVLKNEHVPETELPLFLGENVLGRDGSTCTVSLPSPSVSKRHATISISLYRSRGDVDMEALVWDLGSLNGTRKGRLKLTPNVRYALSEQDSLVLADIPCQFVSCSADTVSPQHNFKMPVSVSSGVDSRLTDASNKKESGPDVGREESDRAPEAKASSPPLKDTKNTPVRTICLSFEKTPTQPEGTLVPESDVDSDEESKSRASRRQKTLGLNSDSDLNKSVPTCSSFLSPTNKVVPESEDESPITPPISTKYRPHRHVSFNKEETNINVGRQQLKEKTASEEEDDRAALEGKFSAGNGPPTLENQECNIDLKDDYLPVSTPAVITDAFEMDSDTDLEGEEEGVASATALTLSANQRVDHTADRAQFYMDSDTDVEENDDAPHTAPESAPPPGNKTRSIPAVPVLQTEGIPLDSDTDVDDDNAPVQSRTPAESAPTTHLKHFHLDSEDEDMKPVQSISSFKITVTPTKLAETVSAALPRPDSQTDDEAVAALAAGKSAATESGPAADAHAALDILSDSGTDVEPDSPLVKQTCVGTDMLRAHGTASEAIQSDSDADTDVEGSGSAPLLERVTAAGLHEEGEKDVGDEVRVAAPGEGQMPGLVRENTPGLSNPSHQHCSTPVQLPGVAITALRTEALVFDSDSQEDENVVGAETQCFVLPTGACQASRLDRQIRETTQASGPATTEDEVSKQSCREGSFRLGLSDSSHLQDPLQALAMESTQAFVSVEATQLCAASSHAHQTSATNEAELEATQAYGEEEPAICSTVPEREGRGDFSIEPTQAYVSDPYQDSENETDDDEKRAIATVETQPFYAPLPMAETQPMCASEEEDVKVPVSPAVRVKVRSRTESEEGGEHIKAVRSQERPFTQVLSLAETQPMCTSDDRDSDEEDSFPCQRKHKTKQLQIEDEQTQPLTSSEQALVETQPLQSADENLAPGGSEAFHEDSSANPNPKPNPGNSGALQKNPALIPTDPSAAETQLMITGEDEQSEESTSFLALPGQKAKPLRYQEEETQTLAVCESSVSETQPMNSGGEADGVASLPGTGVTKAKPPQTLEEEATLRTNSESSIRETPLLGAEAGSNVGGTRAGSRNTSTQQEQPSRRRTRGRTKAAPAAAPRATSKSSWEEEQEDEEEEHPKEGGGMKPRRERNEVGKNEPEASPVEKEGEARGRTDTDLRSHLRENSEEDRKEAGEREETEQEEMHVGMKEEKERIEAENAQRLRLEWERAEREKRERERKEQEERAERRQNEREDEERLEHVRAEREDKEGLEREKNARMSSDSKDQEEKEILEGGGREEEEKLEGEVQHHRARREREAKQPDRAESSEKGKVTEEKILQEQKEEDEAKVSARGRRAARRTAAAEAAKDTIDDVPARRTRSRSNSSNSVSSERSATSVHVQESRGRGRGRGRGARRTSDPPHAVASRSSNRRKTVAVPPTQVASCDDPGGLFQSSQGPGRASQQRPRGGRAEADSLSPAISQGDLQTAARGRKNNKPESSHETQKAATSRGRWRSSSNGSENAEAESCWNRGQRSSSGESKTHVRGRSQKAAEREAVVSSNLDETKQLRKGRKREAEANGEDDSGSSSKFPKEEEKEEASGEAQEAAQHQAQNEVPGQAKRRGRASTAGRKKPPEASDSGAKDSKERGLEEAGERGRARPSVARKDTKEEQRDAEASELEPEVQTPGGGPSRKRPAPVDSSPLAKTPRPSSLSPAAGVRSRVLSPAYKVLFTGMVDEAGERVLARLGGSMAKGVADMNCLVTDKVRRTVKLLCAVAKGIPVVTTQWLEKSGKAGSFLPPSSFAVEDEEQEQKFSFCLQEALLAASRQPLLQGYHIHVTKSVKPEPVQMKDILRCSGATFLPKMPCSHQARTVVISCEEDWRLCAPALAASVPVVTAEFVLTGILQQKLDVQTHALPPPAGGLQPAAGRARGRKKT